MGDLETRGAQSGGWQLHKTVWPVYISIFDQKSVPSKDQFPMAQETMNIYVRNDKSPHRRYEMLYTPQT